MMVLETELGIIHSAEWPRRTEHEQFRETVSALDLEDEDSEPTAEAEWRYMRPRVDGSSLRSCTGFPSALPQSFPVPRWVGGRDGRAWSPCCSAFIASMVGLIKLALYRKKECLVAVKKAMEESFPDGT